MENAAMEKNVSFLPGLPAQCRALASTLFARLPDNDRALGRLAFKLSDHRLTICVVGFDRPGTLAHVTRKLLDAQVDIEACFGEALASFAGGRFKDIQGCFFE